jgi:predicted N-formylglutamate amidohydrolase
MSAGLLEDEEPPALVVNGDGRSPYVLICEHASNRLPGRLGTLGLGAAELERHIAWDLGAEQVARRLSRLTDAPLVLQRYSRLAYDCNRPPDSADAMPEISETTAIPGNRNLSLADKLARIGEIYRPFHATVAELLDRRAAAGVRSLVVSIHSFTPVYKGERRTVEVGLLFDRDPRLAEALFGCFATLDARFNQPYGPEDGVLHTLNLHAAPRGLLHVMIEIRNDFLSDERGRTGWSERLAAAFAQAAAH